MERRALFLIDLVYEATIHASVWERFVDELSRSMGDAAVSLSLNLPGAAGQREHSFRAHLQQEYRAVFGRHFFRGLPWGSLTSPRFTDGFASARHAFPDGELTDTDFYREWMEPQGLAPEAPLAFTIAVEEGRALAGVAIYRRNGGRHFGDDDLTLANLLVPHLSRAYQLHFHIGELQLGRIALTEVIDRMGVGVVLLDGRRRVVGTNRSADQILEMGDGLLMRADELCATHADDNLRLRDRVLRCFDPTDPAPERPEHHIVGITRPSGRRPFPVVVTRLSATARPSDPTAPAAAIFVSDLDTFHIRRIDQLQVLYGLTPAEARLAELLAAGSSVEEAAKARKVKVNTARSQLKQIYSKTNTKRQSDLVRLVLTGILPVRED